VLLRLAARLARVLSKSFPPRGGWRAEKRSPYWCPRFFRIAAGASRRANQRQIFRSPGRAFAWVRFLFLRYRASRSLSAKENRRDAPRRLERLSTSSSRSSRPEADSATNKSSACSRQGLVVDPGGAPTPPECSDAKGTRGHRTPSRDQTPLERAPQLDEVHA